MKKTIIFGLNAASKSIIEAALNNEIKIDIDYIYIDKEYIQFNQYMNIPIIDDLSIYKNQNCIITSFDRQTQRKWFSLAKELNMTFRNVIHEDNYISKTAIIGEGCIIDKNNIIENDVIIGDYLICGFNNRIGHDSVIGNNLNIYVKSNIGGYNKIGNNVTIASSVSTAERITIEDNVKISLGSVVFDNIEKNLTVFGNPAKLINF